MIIENSRGSMWRKWDLHIHSNASPDGHSSPLEIILAAKEKGISVIALTDHHTVNNLNKVKQLGLENGIAVISGIEFRTEYGQKSVHMIGLFPDKDPNGRVLDEEALKDLVLAPLGLSRTEILEKGHRADPSLDDNDAYRKGLLLTQVDFKNAANIIHSLGGVVSVHAGAKENSIEEMRHEGTGPRNVSELADSLGPLKEELLAEYIDICEVRNAHEAEFYICKWQKASIIASDAHKQSDIASKFTWIKGEPNFDGLKQILFEPVSRVSIQSEEPEQKNDYLVIDSLQINDHPDFGSQIIPFNPGLNTIIGGRSSGKSILLGCIARLSGDTTPIKKHKKEYDDYVSGAISQMRLHWRDGLDLPSRKVAYFPQGHIIGFASNQSQIRRFVENILNEDEAFRECLISMERQISTLKGKIFTAFINYNSVKKSLTTEYDELSALGSEEAIRLQIEKINAFLDRLNASTKLTEDQQSKYNAQKKYIADKNEYMIEANRMVDSLIRLFDSDLFVDISNMVTSLDPELKEKVGAIYHDLHDEITKTWQTRIHELITQYQSIAESARISIEDTKNSADFVLAEKTYAENQEYTSQLEKRSIEIKRLDSIIEKKKSISEKEERLHSLLSEIIEDFKQFYVSHAKFSESIKIEREGITIYPTITFDDRKYHNIVDFAFDGRTAANQRIINFTYQTIDSFIQFIDEVCKDILSGKVYTLKGNDAPEQVVEKLLSTDFFNTSYIIQYQNDDLSTMSEGKMAFVILKMLLEFSDNDYPILIDQPEDDLDNRAIYYDLVKYIKEKKKNRQIILVTHNPNIVVGADAEEIIVANQNGVENHNPENKKFAYYSGALEVSFQCDKEEILLQKGIREHVCEILEGGEQAFQIREHKYQLS